jgi:hypothetical protein
VACKQHTYHEELDDKIRHVVRVNPRREDAEYVANNLEDSADHHGYKIPCSVPEQLISVEDGRDAVEDDPKDS